MAMTLHSTVQQWSVNDRDMNEMHRSRNKLSGNCCKQPKLDTPSAQKDTFYA